MKHLRVLILESHKKIRKITKDCFTIGIMMFLDRRGFTLGEVLASLIALGIIALTVQSLILFANSFLNQQETALSSLQEQVMFSSLLCHKFQRPVFTHSDESRSFKYDSTSGSYTKISDNRPDPDKNPAVFSVPLLDKSDQGTNTTVQNLSVEVRDPKHLAVKTFLQSKLNVANPSNYSTYDPTDAQTVLRAHINDKAANFNNVQNSPSGGHNYYSQFYDIYADDHTLPTFMVHQVEGGTSSLKLGTISDGFIYASRCIKNENNGSNAGSFIEIDGQNPKYSIIDFTDRQMEEEEVKATALYVLEQKWRPFYFPGEEEIEKQILCCDIDTFTASSTPPTPITANSTTCKNLKEYTPIVYVISISSKDEEGDGIEDQIKQHKSLEGYAQNRAADFRSSNKSCEDTAPGKIDLAGRDTTTGESCLEAITNKYFDDLGKKIVHPVTFKRIEELPFVKKDRINTWAYAFLAPTFSNINSGYRELKVLSVENKCHASMPVGFCGKLVPGTPLDESNIKFLISKARHCPFRYLTMENSASPMPLGLDRAE